MGSKMLQKVHLHTLISNQMVKERQQLLLKNVIVRVAAMGRQFNIVM